VPLRTPGRAFILLLLALCAGSAAPTAPAQAAPAAPEQTVTNMAFHLNVAQPARYCAGQTYSIRVTPLVDLDGRAADGRRFHYEDRIVTGVPIKADTSDHSIARIEPSRQTSGALEMHESTSLTDRPGFGEVTFRLHALKAGFTNLYLTAEVPRQFSGGRPRYFGPRGDPAADTISIVDCSYLVTAVYTWEFSGAGFRYWTVGTLRARITATDPEYYGGDGTFNFFYNHYDQFCSERTSYRYPNHVTARRNFATDELGLTFSMESPEAGSSQGCPNTYNTFLLSGAPLTDPASPWRDVPIKFPVAGGSKRIQLVAPAPYGSAPAGWATITVTPIVSGGSQ
jgi:hypothetical protein